MEIVKISKIKNNPNNPRLIKDEKFSRLVNSIKQFPQMLELRPIVVNKDMIVLGGNMRLKACIEAGLKEVPIIKASELTEEQQREFIIKDNIGFGEWDWEMLANEWDNTELVEWGLDVPVFDKNVDLDDFFNEEPKINEDGRFIIKLEYTEEDYNLVLDAFDKMQGSKESILFRLLKLEK